MKVDQVISGIVPSAPLREFAERKAVAAELSFGRNLRSEAQAAEQNMRNIGNRTFYRRNNQWVDSQITKEQQQNARQVKQFSPEYFQLADQFGRTMSRYMAFDEPVLLNLGGQAYLIEP